jgi:protein-disulfide isomerase
MNNETPKIKSKRKQRDETARAQWWKTRAKFRVGKTPKQRQAQYQQQTSILLMTVLVTLVVGGLFMLFNWRNAGATKTVSCADFPEYCVPLAGGSDDERDLEAADTRELDEESHGVPGVVRYVAADNVVTIGNPAAPIHIRTVSDFACSHCNSYHNGDLHRFIEDYVLTGQATVSFVLYTGIGGQPSVVASQAALCAGEQGAFWEMSTELFRLARSLDLRSAFSLSQIRSSADSMGLNTRELTDCVTSDRYQLFLEQYRVFANDHGVTGTPTVFVSYGNSGEWQLLDQSGRSYANMKALTEAANVNAQ